MRTIGSQLGCLGLQLVKSSERERERERTQLLKVARNEWLWRLLHRDMACDLERTERENNVWNENVHETTQVSRNNWLDDI
jgi:hypothetical protein